MYIVWKYFFTRKLNEEQTKNYKMNEDVTNIGLFKIFSIEIFKFFKIKIFSKVSKD